VRSFTGLLPICDRGLLIAIVVLALSWSRSARHFQAAAQTPADPNCATML
jgi:hypothetical protein